MHFHPKVSAIKGIINDLDKLMQDDTMPLERANIYYQNALGAINGISDLKGVLNGDKTNSKSRVRK